MLVYNENIWLSIRYSINELSWEPIAATRPMVCNRL